MAKKNIGMILNSIEDATLQDDKLRITFKNNESDIDILFILSDVVMEITNKSKTNTVVKEYPKTLLKRAGLFNSDLLKKTKKEQSIIIPINKKVPPESVVIFTYHNEGRELSVAIEL